MNAMFRFFTRVVYLKTAGGVLKIYDPGIFIIPCMYNLGH